MGTVGGLLVSAVPAQAITSSSNTVIKELKKVKLTIVIVFLGAKPYPTMGNVLEIKDFLNNGRRLTKPHGCLPEM